MNQRQIKFRIWNKEYNCWVDDVNLNLSGKIVPLDFYSIDYIDFTSCVIMQFTGLHDKNGKEIWEGDVLKDDEQEEVSVIRFGEITIEDRGHVGFYHKILIDNLLEFVPLGGGDGEYSEVIGNIYENPELMVC